MDTIARLKEQRDANLQVIQMTEDAKVKDFSLATGQSEGNNQAVQSMLAQIERKVEEDTF